MSSKSVSSRRPLTLLTKVTMGALFVNALAYASELIRLGPFDPEVSTVVALLLVATAAVAAGWRWTPLLGGSRSWVGCWRARSWWGTHSC
jgi:hypothetical protein